MKTNARLMRLERLIREAVVLPDCICFPPDEPPVLVLKAEIAAAEAILCPLHGVRFSKPAPTIFAAPQFIRPAHLQPESWLQSHSEQYVKALKASFPPDRWPATEVTGLDGSVQFLLKDGTEVHGIPPPPDLYDYQTGKLIGRLSPRHQAAMTTTSITAMSSAQPSPELGAPRVTTHY